MTRAPDPIEPTSRVRRGSRGIWVIVFFVGGLLALPAVLGAIFDLRAALPWLAISALCLALGGFEIWRADHPAANPRVALGAWIARLLAGAIAFVALLLGRAYPELVVAVLVIWGLVMLGLLVVISRIGSGAPPKAF